jgi:hypothetical protein
VSDAAFFIHDPTGIDDGEAPEFSLELLSPNPLQGPATFALTVPYRCRVHVAIYDVLGREIIVLADRVYSAGRHELTWTGCSARGAFPSGVYFSKMETTDTRLTKKLVLVR